MIGTLLSVGALLTVGAATGFFGGLQGIIVAAIVVLGVLIFVHELGHFLVAKACGVGVTRFSLGFGPKVVGKKVGETEYVLSAVPMGGYVKMVGEAPGEDLRPEDVARSFTHKPLKRKVAIVLAGPAANALFAIVAFTVVALVGFPVLVAEVGEVKEGYPAAQAGIKPGDRVVAIGERAVARWDEMAAAIRASRGATVSVTVQRGEERVAVNVTPRTEPVATPFGEQRPERVIGVTPSGSVITERTLNPVAAVARGVEQTARLTALIAVGIVKLIQGVVPAKDLGGPILIAKLAGDSARAGATSLLQFMAFLSINLFILNLLPIPVLDGGHLAFFALEALIGRPMSLRWKEMAQQAGFLLLILLMVYVFYNDFTRLFTIWLQ